MANIDITKPLLECLKQFKGAPEGDKETRQKALEEDFVLLAKKLLYGGYYIIGNDYRIEIQTVEFYYHEEEKSNTPNRIYDPIVYHKNGRYPSNTDIDVPPFPIMSLHTHQSGIDITFEDQEGKYRASALIRAFTVFDFRINEYMRWYSKEKTDGIYKPSKLPEERSQYIYYYINGFVINGMNNNPIQWVPTNEADYSAKLYYGRRKNVFKDKDKKELDPRKWAFSKYQMKYTHENKEPEEFELLPA